MVAQPSKKLMMADSIPAFPLYFPKSGFSQSAFFGSHCCWLNLIDCCWFNWLKFSRV